MTIQRCQQASKPVPAQAYVCIAVDSITGLAFENIIPLSSHAEVALRHFLILNFLFFILVKSFVIVVRSMDIFDLFLISINLLDTLLISTRFEML